ncbi:MAG: D-alanyl-D-alanine carboxypeptidase family protein, partial [Minisyncoccia bacterium]
MKSILSRVSTWSFGLSGVLAIALIAGGAYVWDQYTNLVATRAELDVSRKSISELQEKLAGAQEEHARIQDLLGRASEENAAFGQRVDELARSVNYLDKLSKTDRELLQKYSSVYFLSENFTPDPLVPINTEMLARTQGSAMIHGEIFPFLERMMRTAKTEGAPLLILSAYRSFGEQSAVKSNYKVTYGAGANKFSADQGYSEHQLGSTVDFVTPESPASLTKSFSTTPQYEWLTKNAYKYGFVLSYPEGNTFFQFEPWHWRFVGVDL